MSLSALHKNPKHSWKLKLGVVLFLVGQVFSFAHASEYGSAAHEHIGVACVAVLNDEHDVLATKAQLAAPAFFSSACRVLSTHRVLPTERLRTLQPPATGPPSI